MATIEQVTEDLEGLQAPWGGHPWASPSGDDFSTVDPVDALRSYPGDLAWLLRIRAWDAEASEPRDVLISSHGYHTGGDGSGSAEGLDDFSHFTAGLLNPGSTKVSIVSGGTLKSGATPSHGNIKISNADGRHNALLRLRLRRRPYDLWVGEARWSGPRFIEFAEARSGAIEDLTWDAKTITLSIRDPKALLDIDINPVSYLGFGVGIRLRVAGDGVSIDPAVAYHPDALHLRLMFEVRELSNSVLVNYGWEEDDPRGWEMRLTADGSILWVQDNWDPFIITPTASVDANNPHRASFEGGPAGMVLYVDGVEMVRDPTPYLKSALIDPSTTSLLFGKRVSF